MKVRKAGLVEEDARVMEIKSVYRLLFIAVEMLLRPYPSQRTGVDPSTNGQGLAQEAIENITNYIHFPPAEPI